MTDGGPSSRSALSTAAATAGWGLFCSSSWTWCIGMYLPVILLRNWGWPGFWVFAVFNVVGCAGFGYLCSRQRSLDLCERHAPAMTLFSVVTVAYQVFFVAFLASWVAQIDLQIDRAGPGTGPSTVPVTWLVGFAAMVLGSLLSLAPDRAWPWLGAAATGVSYATWMALAPRVTPEVLAQASGTGSEGGLSLLLAAPIIAFGFLLCPWLDRTFHRARQLAPSVHGFGVFGATFFPIITMTAIYGVRGELDPTAPILAHLGTQLLFTIAVHVREIRLSPSPRSGPRARGLTLLTALGGGLLIAEASGFLGLPFETGYLLFLGCYGLLFPAYALLFMTAPRERAPLPIRPWPMTVRALGGFALLILLLAPLCAMGFIALKTWTLPIALVAVFASAIWGHRLVGGTKSAS